MPQPTLPPNQNAFRGPFTFYGPQIASFKQDEHWQLQAVFRRLEISWVPGFASERYGEDPSKSWCVTVRSQCGFEPDASVIGCSDKNELLVRRIILNL